MRLAAEIYAAFDSTKDFEFCDQICRVAISGPSNIAEGYERGSDKDFVHFLRISSGSVAEFRTQLYLAIKLNKIESEAGNQLIAETRTISAQRMKLSQYRTQG